MEEILEKADEIKLLRWPYAIRNRIGMYLGGTDAESVNNLIREILDNSIDECQRYANKVLIDRNFNGFNTVMDNGRGISIEYSKDVPEKISADLSISELHSGSKFTDNKLATVGQNGVGSSAVCACSEDYILLSKITELNYNKSTPEVLNLWNSCIKSKKDLFYIVWYKKGIKYYEGALKKKDAETMIFGKKYDKEIPQGMSTIVFFNPDPELFTETTKMSIPVDNIQYFLLIQEKFYKRKISVLVEGAEMTSSSFEGFGDEVITTIIPADTTMNEKIGLLVSVGYDPDLGNKVQCGSVNSLKVDSGAHLNYVEDCFSKAIKSYYDIKHKFTTNGLKLCVVAIASEVIFASQVKDKLKNFTGAKLMDFAPLIKDFQKMFKKNPEYWDFYAEQLNKYADSMKALSASDKAKKMIDGASGSSFYKSKSGLVDGFSDATCKDRWECELFLCEGLSPAGSLKSGRKMENGAIKQAVLPLKGKILNVSDTNIDKALENKEISTIFTLLGVGIQENNVTSDCKTYEEAFEKLKKYARYGKIVIAADADSDGSQIMSLILYLFSKYARFLIDLGCVYVLEGPLFEQGGQYFFPSDPIDKSTGFPIGLNNNKPFKRWKGLGSINKEELYDAYFNPATRKLIQVTPENIEYAMSLTENIEVRKNLLIEAGIISNPFNFED